MAILIIFIIMFLLMFTYLFGGAISGSIVAPAGQSGPNDAYVLSTINRLRELGIRDHWLEGVARHLPPRGASDSQQSANGL